MPPLTAVHSAWMLNVLQVCLRTQAVVRLVTTWLSTPRYETCEKSGLVVKILVTLRE